MIDAKCPTCGKKFEDILVKRTDEEVKCPGCGASLLVLPPKTNWAWGKSGGWN